MTRADAKLKKEMVMFLRTRAINLSDEQAS